MQHRIFVFAIIALLGSTASSPAEKVPAKNDTLKKLLEEKYSQPSSTEKPIIYDKKDLEPNPPKTPPAPANTAPPGRTEWLAPLGHFSNIAAIDANRPSVLLQLADNRTSNGPAFVVADTRALDAPNARSQSQSSSSAGNLVVAQQRFEYQKAARFAIQLRPGTVDQQIQNLLRKYNLRHVGADSINRLLLVESNDPRIAPTDINPPVIRELRKEPIVANAFVDVPMSTRSLPSAVDLLVKRGSETYNWLWGKLVSRPLDSGSSQTLDGNWGLKAIRMPPVWTIIHRNRAAKSKLVRPKLAIIDTGFSKHDDLVFNLLSRPNHPITEELISRFSSTCNTAHGNHVLGIVGATFNNGIGIDGIIPNAIIDAVPWKDSLVGDSDPTAEHAFSRTVLSSEVLSTLTRYLAAKTDKSPLVVNLSNGTNFRAHAVAEGDNPEKIPGAKDHLIALASVYASNFSEWDLEDSVLFVIAAGNDSAGLFKPLDAKWSHPLAWLASGELPVDIKRPKNILVVEAVDRNGQRIADSNMGGHVAAPGNNILSTLWPGDNAYDLCDGTSMAAPHVAGVATLLFELDPTKKPADIINIIKTSAIAQKSGPGAPQLDALEAVLKLSPYNDFRNNYLVSLSDLNGDGRVDTEDMKIFVRDLAAIENNRKNGTPFSRDLNGDGKIDNNECHWPSIDLNGDGRASLSLADAKIVLGKYRTDLDVMGLAWTDKTKSYYAALKETGLDVAQQAADMARTSPVSPQACR
jgi:hypothetical protein